MDHSIQLLNLMISDKFTSDEKQVAENLRFRNNLQSLLQDLSHADLVVVPSIGFPTSILNVIFSFSNLNIVMFPVSATGVLSISPNETSKHMADVVCSLLKKLFPLRDGSFKGVISTYTGVQLNNCPEPGALIWTIRHCSAITFKVNKIDLMLSVSFIDPFTMRSNCVSDRLSIIIPPKDDGYSANCLVGKIEEVMHKEMSTETWANKFRGMIEGIVPGLTWKLNAPVVAASSSSGY